MGLKGKFEWYISPRSGGRKAISFTLQCDNLFQNETFDCAIMANNGSTPPMVFRNQKLKSKHSLQFNFDTVDWQWCNGDTFVILGKNDSIKKSWPLNLQTYAPGECPDCHGTHKCRNCSGRGFTYLRNRDIENCQICSGTGICQTCYIPIRQANNTIPTYNPENRHSTDRSAKARQIEALRSRISELQQQIESTQWDMRMMQIRDMDGKSSNVYLSYNQLLHQYKINMINLQSQLRQLEQS